MLTERFVDEILSIATAMRRIEITVEDYAAVYVWRLRRLTCRKLTSTHKALLAALSDVLEHVKQQVSDLQGKSTASEQTWLARSLALEDVGLLGKALCDVICWVSAIWTSLTASPYQSKGPLAFQPGPLRCSRTFTATSSNICRT